MDDLEEPDPVSAHSDWAHDSHEREEPWLTKVLNGGQGALLFVCLCVGGGYTTANNGRSRG